MNFRKILYVLVIASLFTVGDFVSAQGLIPNDPDYSKQWYLDKLQMPVVWAQESGTKDVVIAVIDSGVNISHPDLHDNIWVNQKEILGDGIDNDMNGYIDDINGWDFIDNNNDPAPKYPNPCSDSNNCLREAVFHGTVVAGVAAAIGNNGIGIAGMTWHAKIMPLRVLDQNGSGNTVDVTRAIEYAVANGADIINLSFVGDTFDLGLEQALERAYQKGLIIVAAGGNEDIQGNRINLNVHKMYPICNEPANHDNIIIGVGAVDDNNKLAIFSNYGSSCIDILAPGDNFYGAVVYNPLLLGFKLYYDGGFSGTSLAAPVISGIAALIKSAKPSLTNSEVRDLILNNADNIDALNPEFAGQLGKGLVDPVKVFQALKVNVAMGQLIKGSGSTIYYYALDGKRYVFPDQATFYSWFDDFKSVKTISAADLAQIPLGGNVTMRPGVYLIKLLSSPQVYAVSQGGVLRFIESEQIAQVLYGVNWAKAIRDISDAYFTNYKIGATVAIPADFDPFIEKNTVVSIDIDKGLK